MRTTAARLEGVTRDAARETGADVVDAAAITRHHDTCAAAPWVTAAHPGVLAVPLHPNLAGMTALALGIAALVK